MVLPLRSTRRQRRRPRSRGQALVEFALVVPIFLLLLAGMIDFGVGLYSYMTINNAARDGARLGATACSSVACEGAVEARVLAAASGLGPTVDVDCTAKGGGTLLCEPKTPSVPTGVEKGDSVTVSASYTYHMIWPLAFGNQIQMDAVVTFMIE